MFSVTKVFTDIPIGHRQHNHTGHCKYIHGHNWGISVTIASRDLDENGFVFDFGNFKDFRAYLNEVFDHSVLINESDPEMSRWVELNDLGLMKVTVVPLASCEGLAAHFFQYLSTYVRERTPSNRFARVTEVTVTEDSKNSATVTGPR